jgi:hypothetical protein
VQLGPTGLEIVKDRALLRFRYIKGNDTEPSVDADIRDWREPEWHHVAAIWTRSSMELYVDGRQAFLNRRGSRQSLADDAKLSVGSAPTATADVAPAQLSYLAVLNRNASFDEVLELLRSGGPSRD